MSNRRAELAKIHMGAAQLGIDTKDKSEDSAYRSMLKNVAGVTSSSKLDEDGRHKVIAHLKICGANFTRGKRPHNFDHLPEYITKVEALLADMRLPWSYADTIARNITGGKGAPEQDKDPGVEKLAWVKGEKNWRAIVAALVVEQEKRGLLANVDELLQKLSKDRDYLSELYKSLPKKWERNRGVLRTICDQLLVLVEAEDND